MCDLRQAERSFTSFRMTRLVILEWTKTTIESPNEDPIAPFYFAPGWRLLHRTWRLDSATLTPEGPAAKWRGGRPRTNHLAKGTSHVSTGTGLGLSNKSRVSHLVLLCRRYNCNCRQRQVVRMACGNSLILYTHPTRVSSLGVNLETGPRECFLDWRGRIAREQWCSRGDNDVPIALSWHNGVTPLSVNAKKDSFFRLWVQVRTNIIEKIFFTRTTSGYLVVQNKFVIRFSVTMRVSFRVITLDVTDYRYELRNLLTATRYSTKLQAIFTASEYVG